MTRPGYSIGDGSGWDDPRLLLDQRRHEYKVREAIRKNLADMISDEKILMTDGQRVVTIPVPQFLEFRIRFDPLQNEHVGHKVSAHQEGDGQKTDTQTGVGSKEGGDTPGLDVQETSITLEEVSDLVFHDLELPDLDPFREAPGLGQNFDPVTIGRAGLKSRWDKKATLKASLLRQRLFGRGESEGLIPEDIRYRVIDPVIEDQGGAVVLAMMDTSGSMGTFEKYLAKSFFFWTVEFLRRNYPRVDIVFLAHDVRAREVDEETFFHRGASGGTVSSSVYKLALDVLGQRFPSDRYNAYAFHFTDGGNLTSDNTLAVETGKELAKQVNLFGYGEIHDTERNASPLYQEFKEVSGIGVMVLRGKEDIFRALSYFFGDQGEMHHA